MLLAHIISKEGITVHPGKVQDIMDAKAPRNTKELMRFFRQIRWHSRVLRFLADLATPLHVAIHATPFSWTQFEVLEIYKLLIILAKALVVQPPDWTNTFLIFVYASDIASRSILMQQHEPRWFCLVYYASRCLSKAKRNYNTTKREALGMIYSVEKFCHYLLGNTFTIHVDNSTLL